MLLRRARIELEVLRRVVQKALRRVVQKALRRVLRRGFCGGVNMGRFGNLAFCPLVYSFVVLKRAKTGPFGNFWLYCGAQKL